MNSSSANHRSPKAQSRVSPQASSPGASPRLLFSNEEFAEQLNIVLTQILKDREKAKSAHLDRHTKAHLAVYQETGATAFCLSIGVADRVTNRCACSRRYFGDDPELFALSTAASYLGSAEGRVDLYTTTRVAADLINSGQLTAWRLSDWRNAQGLEVPDPQPYQAILAFLEKGNRRVQYVEPGSSNAMIHAEQEARACFESHRKLMLPDP